MPALAGGLITLIGAPLAVLVDAASFLVSGALLATARVAEPAPTQVRGSGSMLAEVREGLSWVYRHDTLRPLALGTHAWFFFMAIAGAVVTPFALRTVGLNPFSLGLALAMAGLGGLVGALFAVRLGRRYGAGRVVVASRLVTALAWALIALSPTGPLGWSLFALGQLVLGLELGAENSNEMGYRQIVTPDRLQGRMNTTMLSLNRATIVLGAPLGGSSATDSATAMPSGSPSPASSRLPPRSPAAGSEALIRAIATPSEPSRRPIGLRTAVRHRCA